MQGFVDEYVFFIYLFFFLHFTQKLHRNGRKQWRETNFRGNFIESLHLAPFPR